MQKIYPVMICLLAGCTPSFAAVKDSPVVQRKPATVVKQPAHESHADRTAKEITKVFLAQRSSKPGTKEEEPAARFIDAPPKFWSDGGKSWHKTAPSTES